MSELQIYKADKSFLLENGERIENLELAYHTFGTLNQDKSNVVWVFHAISGSSNVLDWWDGLFGPDKQFDPADYFIVCANTIGSPYGSTRPMDANFPTFSMRDVVKAHQLLASHLRIDHINIAIGASFGGNQALEFAYTFQGKIDKMILLASCARESAWGIAIHESQRLAMKSDVTFGTLSGGVDGMKAARSMAMLMYRTSEKFIDQQTDTDDKLDDFIASSYVRYQGDKFAQRFDALSYYYLTKCLDTHNIGRGRGGEERALSRIQIPTLVVGIESDTLIPVRFQKFMVEHLPHAKYMEIESSYGHDGFLVENEKITACIQEFLAEDGVSTKVVSRTVLKFGGKSLTNDMVPQVLKIVKNAKEENAIVLLVSARADSTDTLLSIYEKSLKGENYVDELEAFFALQRYPQLDWIDTVLEEELRSIFQALDWLRIGNENVRDRILSYGERFSARFVAVLLQQNGLKAEAVDSDQLIALEKLGADWEVNHSVSEKQTSEYFASLGEDVIPVVTGFFGKDSEGQIRTLGRNGSNYSATLIASYIRAKEVQNWTDVAGIFTADPRFVPNAEPITYMSYREANELANFGVNVLHSKTILPLIRSDIPLRIMNTAKPENLGTRIDSKGSGKGIKAVSLLGGVSIVRIEGRGLNGKVGIDGRIFNVLSRSNISVRLISQASSERGIGFVIDTADSRAAERLLQQEFEKELHSDEISTIEVDDSMAIIAIVGRHNYALEKAIQVLRKNRIWMHLISNSISGEHISLVVSAKDMKKAIRVVHSQVFGVVKVLNVFAFGKGTVGGRFIDQVIQTHTDISHERNLLVNVIGVADSQKLLINECGVDANWREQLQQSTLKSNVDDIIATLQESGLENITVVDNTSATEIAVRYEDFVRAGFDVVASNKKSNTMSMNGYNSLRKLLKRRGRSYFYETNVGAGLPVIDTLKQLRNSADKVTRIRGVFSGSMSYVFNNFCDSNDAFSEILMKAKEGGYTEPDPREDLSGMDVARKLVILAREVGVSVELDQVQIQNLVPGTFPEDLCLEEFLANKTRLDDFYHPIRSALDEGKVLRYVGDLDVTSNTLRVVLDTVDKGSPLGSLKNSDSLFEVYTNGYGDHPIVVQGAGAGAEVTARGVYSDLLRVGMQL